MRRLVVVEALDRVDTALVALEDLALNGVPAELGAFEL
jgi:hypothetical protein